MESYNEKNQHFCYTYEEYQDDREESLAEGCEDDEDYNQYVIRRKCEAEDNLNFLIETGQTGGKAEEYLRKIIAN